MGESTEHPVHPTPQEAEARFRELVENAGVEPPDEVEYDREADELIFRWREKKVAVVVELSADGEGRMDGIPSPPI